MNDFIWAINKNGELTKCTAKPENIGRGRCNHLMHSKRDESSKQLFERYMEYKDVIPLVTDDFKKYDYIELRGFGDYPPILRKPSDEDIVSNAEVYNRRTGEWERNPDKWHDAVDMNNIDYNNITPEAAMKSMLKLDEKVVDFCKNISVMAHEGQYTKAGEPYYLHPKAVAEKCKSPLTKAIAYLHDTIEDTNIDEYKLEAMDIPKVVIDRVSLLTKKNHEKYMDYVENVSNDPIASEVKYCDLKHNTDLTRTGGKILVSEGKWKNYQKSLKLLNDKYHFE